MRRKTKKRVKHSDAKKRFLALLTDPAKGRERLSLKEAVKRANRKFPKERITNVQAAQSMLSKFRRTTTQTDDQWNAMLEAGAKIRKAQKLTYHVISKQLKKDFNTENVPHATTLSAYCRRRGIENGAPANGMSDTPCMIVGDIRLFRSPRKGKMLVEMPKDRATAFIMKEADLEI